MDFSQLPGKVIADRNSQRLGFVVDIRNDLPLSFEDEKPKATMLVKIDRVLRGTITVEVDVEKILKIDGYYAWLDITKKEFLASIKKYKEIKKEKKESKKIVHALPKYIDPPQPTPIKTIKNPPSDTGDLRESNAFVEYTTGRSTKIKTPWVLIIAVGILTAVLSFVLYIFGIVTVGNPYAMNMIIGLLGLPAGFILAFKNKTLDIMVSWRYSSFAGIIYSAGYFIIGLIYTAINTIGTGRFGGAFLSLLLSCLVIGLYSVLCTFALGALLGTMIHGYLDDRK